MESRAQAKFFMSVFEEEHILPKSYKIRVYRKYSDDIFAVWGVTESELIESMSRG